MFGKMNRVLPILLSALAFCLVACSPSERLRRDVTIQNDSKNQLDWVSVKWGGRVFGAGIMPPGKGATIIDASLPANVTAKVAIIEFIDEDAPGLNWKSGSNEEVRARRAESWTRVPVDITQLSQISGQSCHITFRILSLTDAEVRVERTAGK
ncbi:MAG TPA: hypothetical protein VHO24_16145 [Opitutaceae bacterium]|nr:hypothetical protein [Opitutaceae bacterium]